MVTTPNLDLNLPTVGANRDTWGALLNDNFTTLDQSVSMAMPIGALLDFAGPTAPPGWLIADGRLVSRTTYAALFAVIGTYWGAGDGSTTFALPPCPGRASVGPGTVIDQQGHSLSYGFTNTIGLVWGQILQGHLPNYAMATDVQGLHQHATATGFAGHHTHTTDTQGGHNHDGQTQVENLFHSHSGTTDGVGDHTHNVNAWATSGGGSFASPGGVGTQGGVTTGPAGAHAHSFTSGNENSLHVHAIDWDPGHTHTALSVPDHTHAIFLDGNHAHNVWLGGGGSLFQVQNPVICVTKIIYAGQEAVARVLTAAAAPARRLSAPLRGSH